MTIFSMNDVYELEPRNGHGGLAEMMTLLKEEREKADHYLTTMNGNFPSPSLISSIFNGAQMVDLMNRMEIDLVAFGNHEFDFGLPVLRQRMQESHFCWLGTNVLTLGTGLPFDKAKATVAFDIDGLKIGIIGVCTPEISPLMNEDRDVTIIPPILSAQVAVHKLKKAGADVIIALTHLNYEQDRDLAAQVPEIDLILGGHDHEVMTYYNGKTLIHKSGHDAEFLARLDLKIEKKECMGKMKVSVYPKWKMIPNHGIEPNPELSEAIAFYAGRIDKELSSQIAVCESSLTSKGVREAETTMGNLIADALREKMGADLAIINGGSIRGNKNYLPGMALTKRDIQQELPFGNIAVLVELTGEQLLRTLDSALSRVATGGGGFPQVSGLRVIYDSDAMEPICEGHVNGRPIDRSKKYLLATNDYILSGGDGNLALKDANIPIGTGGVPLLTSLVIDYIESMGTVDVSVGGRILDFNLDGMRQIQPTGKRIRFN